MDETKEKLYRNGESEFTEMMIIYGATTYLDFYLAIKDDIKPGILNPLASAIVFGWIEEYHIQYGELPENYHHLYETKKPELKGKQAVFIEHLFSGITENFNDIPFNLPLQINKAKQYISGKRARQLLEDGNLAGARAELERGLNPATKMSVKDMAPKSSIPVFPYEVMGGAAGRFAKAHYNCTEAPEHFLYMSYLTLLGQLFSGRVTLNKTVQARLYLVLLGTSAGTKKSTAINVACKFFRETFPDLFHSWLLSGSAEGLAVILKKYNNLVLNVDEFKALIGKMKSEGSVLMELLNTLFDKNLYQHVTKKDGPIEVPDIYLSILTACTLDTFKAMFDSKFKDIGFDNRFFLVVGDSWRREETDLQSNPPNEVYLSLQKDLTSIVNFVDELTSENSIASVGTYDYEMTPEARATWRAWYLSLNNHKDDTEYLRLDVYGLRIAVLMAINEKKRIIDLEIIQNVLKLLDYEAKVRVFTAPIVADSKLSEVVERIRRELSKGNMLKSRLERDCNKRRSIEYWDKALKILEVESIETRNGNRKSITYSLPSRKE